MRHHWRGIFIKAIFISSKDILLHTMGRRARWNNPFDHDKPCKVLDYKNLNYKYLMAPAAPTQEEIKIDNTAPVRRSEQEDIEHYVGRIRQILETSPTHGVPPEPANVFPGVFLGSTADAENIKLLRKIGITHILNCAGIASRRADRELRYTPPETGIEEYEEIPAQDGQMYDIAGWFLKTHMFIDHARHRGKVLVHCPDVNRSAAIVISYLVSKGTNLIKACKTVKEKRRVGMFNRGFMRQLVQYARDRDLLETDKTFMAAPQFVGMSRVRHRAEFSHCLSVV